MLVVVAIAMPVAAWAQDDLVVRDAYLRSTNSKVAAAFMVIENHGQSECRLSGAVSDAAERVELHTHAERQGVMTMTRIEGGIAIPAGADHALARGGDHVMMMGLRQPLAAGDTVALTLDFGDCGQRQVEVPLDNDHADPAATHGAHAGHGDHAGH